MSSELQWDHHFCLTCDKQTDSATYCSESCRLADYEASSSSSVSSGSCSPSLPAHQEPVPQPLAQPQQDPAAFFLFPAYDFVRGRPSETTTPIGFFLSRRNHQQHNHHAHIQHHTAQHYRAQSLSLPAPVLTPSASHSSLCSVRTSVSNASSAAPPPSQLSQLPETTQRELRAYASSFEQARLQRRRSC